MIAKRNIVIFSLGFVVSLSLLLVKNASAETITEKFNQGRVSWAGVSGADHYTIYYREDYNPKYTHAVHGLKSTSAEYTIGQLKKGRKYIYNIAAADKSRKEFWWSGEKKLTVTAAP